MNKNLTLALTAVFGCALAAQVLAVPPQPNRPPLTADQIARIKAARQANRPAPTPQQQQMQQLSAQLRTELKNNPVDREKVNSLLKQLDALRSANQVEQMQSELDNNKNLTPQQRQRMTERIQRTKARQAQPQK